MHMRCADKAPMPTNAPRKPLNPNDFTDPGLRWAVELLVEKRLDPSTAARKAGLATTTLTRPIYTAEGEAKTIGRKTLHALSRAFSKPLPPELALDAGGAVAMPASATELPRDVPVHGIPRRFADGGFEKNPIPVAFARRPPALDGMRHAYALYMPDDSMAPWRRAGKLIYVQPGRSPGIGDHALIETAPLADPNAESIWYIGRMEGRRDGTLILSRYADDSVIHLPINRILDSQRIIEWDELFS